MKKILIVEDDNSINNMISIALKKEGYECVSAYSGTEALLLAKQQSLDLIILDLMLPGMAGDEVLKKVREISDVPIIVLSAKDAVDVKVALLSLGASDYMTKPFDLKELIARVFVQLRGYTAKKQQDSLTFGELSLDINNKQFFVNGNEVVLTAHEFNIIMLFMKNPGRVFSKNDIYEFAWEDYYIGEDKTVNVHISNLRKKIKKHTDKDYIETLWGLGFKLSEKNL